MDFTRPATRIDQTGARVPTLLGLALRCWRYLQSRSRPRNRTLEDLSDHLLGDVGLTGPGYEQPTWERHIHR